MTLTQGELGQKYMISRIHADEAGMRDFLFTLGCYPGEPVTVISQLASNLIINVKDARYSIDTTLAEAIVIENEIQKAEMPVIDRMFA